MAQMGSLIAPGARLAQMYAERLLKGVTQATYARLARPGGTVIQSNHAAFVLGHLALYPARVLQFLNLPPEPVAAPAQFTALFKDGVACQDDSDGKIYPPLDELSSVFFSGYKSAIDAIAAAPDERFTGPNPAEGRMRELFPTLGSALNFYVLGHVEMHLGQLSAWRRAMGLPPA